ncbi:MAG: folate-binding protein [bacterium]
MTASLAASALLGLPGAVAATGVDAGTAWHYGDPLGEQRTLTSGAGLVDRWNRPVLIVSGPERLPWLHSICSQHVSNLADGATTSALVLSPHGHVEQDWRLTELGGQAWIDVEPGHGEAALAYLQKMIFMKRVDPRDVSAEWAVLSLLGPTAAPVLVTAGYPAPRDVGSALAGPGGGFVRAVEGGFDLVVPRSTVPATASTLLAAGAAPVGAWAVDARRVERREPRLGFETDHRTIPHEIGLIGVSVHLDKGCYRGQETVARVQNLGRPPRRLVLLHLSGEREELPEPGTPVEADGRTVGFLGTAVHHHELGPIALAVVKRTLANDTALVVGGHTAAIDPS